LRPWVQRHRNASRIRLLLRSPRGGWADDADFLLQAFPEASFDVYATASGLSSLMGSDTAVVPTMDYLTIALRELSHAQAPGNLRAGREHDGFAGGYPRGTGSR
jgi:hypothetical protein